MELCLLTSEILNESSWRSDMAIIPGSRHPSWLSNYGWVQFTWMAGAIFEAGDRVLTPEELRKYRIFFGKIISRPNDGIGYSSKRVKFHVSTSAIV